MAARVVDTDVVSFLLKSDTRAQLYRPHLDGYDLVISFMTVAELDRWAIAHNWGLARIARLDAHLQQYIIVPFDRLLCRTWAEVVEGMHRKGCGISTGDAWIAATALRHNIPLVTHNRQHFEQVDHLVVISEA